jgi:hypothetical protein
LPLALAAQPQWLKLQSSVPPRQSIVHIIPDGIVPTFLSATHLSG